MERTCSVDGCSNRHYAKGWCNMHYARARKNGDPLASKYDRRPIAEKLTSRINIEPATGCWLWNGRIGPWGYGQVDAAGRTVAAHRASYQTFVGPISPGLLVCHQCDTPACINPDHLWLGTDADNAADRDAKRRQVAPRGEASGMSVLTEQDVRAIRAAHEAGESQTSIAKRFGVSRPNIGYIVRRETWAHVQ